MASYFITGDILAPWVSAACLMERDQEKKGSGSMCSYGLILKYNPIKQECLLQCGGLGHSPGKLVGD